MSMEVAELLGTGQISGHGVSFAADNIILIRYVESEGRLDRALAILKARGIEHGAELVQLTIDANGVRIGSPLTNLHGVLTGMPSPAAHSGK
jgi:circadian clock protein KaiC